MPTWFWTGQRMIFAVAAILMVVIITLPGMLERIDKLLKK